MSIWQNMLAEASRVRRTYSMAGPMVMFVMRTLALGGDIKREDSLTAEEVRTIRERLHRLGYLKEEK